MRRYRTQFMAFVVHMQRRMAGAAFAAQGITRSQPWILDFLAENNGCIQRELADNSHFDPGTISSALMGMEDRGLILRQSDASDKRVLRVYLTDLGFEKQAYVQSVFAKIEECALTDFTEREQKQFGDYLKRVYKNLQKEECYEKNT